MGQSPRIPRGRANRRAQAAALEQGVAEMRRQLAEIAAGARTAAPTVLDALTPNPGNAFSGAQADAAHASHVLVSALTSDRSRGRTREALLPAPGWLVPV